MLHSNHMKSFQKVHLNQTTFSCPYNATKNPMKACLKMFLQFLSTNIHYQTAKMQTQPASKLIILCTLLTISSLLPHGWGANCVVNDHDHAPTVKQTQVGFGNLTKFLVEISNNCSMCPVINVHLKCGSFPQALVNPRLLKVVGFDDCVINGGLPLAPLQKFSFNYTHNSKYLMLPTVWFFQCE